MKALTVSLTDDGEETRCATIAYDGTPIAFERDKDDASCRAHAFIENQPGREARYGEITLEIEYLRIIIHHLGANND